MTKLHLPSARFTRTRTTWRKELVRRRWQVSRPIANALEGAKSQSFLVAVILTGHGLRACSEAVRPLSASQGLRCPFAWPLTPSVMAAQEKAPTASGPSSIPVRVASPYLRRCRVTGRRARPIPRAPTASRLPVLPLFASLVAVRLLPLDRGRPRGLRQGRRLRDPPKRHPRSRALQALWSGPDHACALACAARRPADLQAGRFQRQAG